MSSIVAVSKPEGCCGGAGERPGTLRSIVSLLLRLALGGLLLLAAYTKLSNPQEFAFSIKAFKILPDHLAVLATFVVPWMEAICGVLLVLGLWARSAALAGVLQLAVFIAAIVSVILRHMNVSCGCFGKYEPFCTGPLGWCNVIQNSVLLVAGLLILALGPGRFAVCRR